jgi:T5SS/PEP-CTERM-associated repeat protein
LGFAAGIVLISRPASDAQYIANSQTNIISGVTSNWAGDYMVGSNTFANVLIVRNNATLNDAGGYLGYSAGSYKNAAIVTAPGSAWNNDTLFVGYSGSNNTLTVTNSGTEYDANAYIGYTNGANNNAILVTGTGSTWYNSGGDTIYDAIYLGYSGSGNTLTVTNGGTVYSGYSYIGEYAGASNNAVIVTGNGSVWYNDEDDNGELHVGDYGSRNTLTITNGGAVINVEGYIGELAGGNSNAVTVTGAGAVWSNSSWLLVGTRGSGNTLSITNGGAVYNANAYIGHTNGANNNAVTVTGLGSLWDSGGNLVVGVFGSTNSLTVATNGSVLASNACVGLYPASAGNQVAITGGGLCVTNAPGTGVLNVLRGALTLNSGTATANRLVITNGANGLFTFNGGTLTSGGTFVTNSQVFAVGDGTDAATFQLAGGVHSFANNLEIRNNATLTGCGTIQGNFTIDPGGTVVANCGGALTFSGVVTNNGTMQAIDGSTLEAYGSVVNNGTIDVINGSTNFHGAFVNHGTVLTAGSVKISQVSRSGQSFVVQIPSATGHSYQLQYTTSLVPANWIDTGTSQAGTGGILTFTDSGATTNAQRFYRIDLTAP